jgi:tRNA pseudouridine38-40 synthase
MERYQIILAYDGTHFLGSQRQRNGRTVQGELEKALREIGWTGRTTTLAGRTDTGVHASAQVAAFDLEWDHGLDPLQRALNANLPQDMAVHGVEVAAKDFHPRFDASSRRYRYRLYCAALRDPLRERYAWRVWPPVSDLKALAGIWTGTHDFAAFGTPPRTGGSTVRTVLKAGWHKHGDEWIFEVQADAFLDRMVRRLVFVQVATGQGRLRVEDLTQALANRTKLPAGLAPPNGLTLVEVRYDNLV